MASEPASRDGIGSVDRVDVVVAGAGMAGLAAARALTKAGRSVRVFESRDRVGGRLLSGIGQDGWAADIGATWFWPGERRVTALVEELGIRIHTQHLAGDALFHDRSGGQRIDGNPIDVPSARFTDGAEGLAVSLAATLEPDVVKLSNPVLAIEHDEAGGDLQVMTGNGSIATDHVVLALPPALAVDRIRFDPPLPERVAGLAAATPVWMASVAKVVIRYDTPFWRDRGLAGAAISHIGPMGEIHDMSGPDGDPAALFGFVRLPSPEEPAPDHAAIEAQLEALFGPDSPSPTEIMMVDWRQDPDTTPQGQPLSAAYQLFGHALYQEPSYDGRLHWASTETATVSPGHIEGAIISGERAADAIIRAGATTKTETRSAP